MLISDAHRAVFVHVQKTGGVSVQALLEQHWSDARTLPGRRHQTYARILRTEPGLGDYFSFGFVRNPWSRMVSWWEMTQWFKQRAAKGDPEALRHLEDNPFLAAVARDYATFEEFVLRGPEEWPRLRRPQLRYLSAGGRQVDFIGRTESLGADVVTVLERLGLAGEAGLPHRNRSRRRIQWRDYYDARTRARVAELFAPDVAEFGYTFEE